MARNGRAAAVSAMALGIGTLGAGGFACRDVVREYLLIARLGTREGPERDQAARALASMGSLRAVRHLIRLIRLDESEDLVRRLGGILMSSSGDSENLAFLEATPLVKALSDIADSNPSACARQLRIALDSEVKSSRVCRILCELLHPAGLEIVEAERALRKKMTAAPRF